jgi:cation diffusion facilitator CzcD-associated flavoprotein CzcO
MATEHLDVVIVGAGLSGICAAYYVQKRCPEKSYALFEGRGASGGTWDLFRYPGVRSDSDMHTLGYSFRPWPAAKAIADGPAILSYVRETAQIFGIDKKIRFNHRLRRASWSSEDALWTLEVEQVASSQTITLTCSFLFMCTGYYEYEQGFLPQWAGMADFQGRLIHPQQWPEDLDYAGKQVVVIGSGATAVTLVPAMAEAAAHVTMVQRSPTYIVARPSQDAIAQRLQRVLPSGLAHALVRWKNIAFGMYFYHLTRRRPRRVKEAILKMTRAQLGPDYDVEKDFSPTYNPWDQRLCLVPDGDLFQAIKQGRASVVTDQIETFTPTGLRLHCGMELPADIIITATGLNMHLMNGVQLLVDGQPVDLSQTLSYRGMMYSDVPNLASAFGYTNASWTLKCELIARYVVRLLNYMDRHGYVKCLPQRPDSMVGEDAMLNLSSGYVRRAQATLPRQGRRNPWRIYQNYLRDVFHIGLARINDGTMRFTAREKRAVPSWGQATEPQGTSVSLASREG